MKKKEPKLEYLTKPPRRELSAFETWLIAFLSGVGLAYIMSNYFGAN